MSNTNNNPLNINKLRVMAFIDGFNLYHALDKFSAGTTKQQNEQYRKYKWLCLTSLIKCFVDAAKEELVAFRIKQNGWTDLRAGSALHRGRQMNEVWIVEHRNDREGPWYVRRSGFSMKLQGAIEEMKHAQKFYPLTEYRVMRYVRDETRLES